MSFQRASSSTSTIAFLRTTASTKRKLASETLRRGADEIVVKDKASAAFVPEGNEYLTRLEALVPGGRSAKQAWTDVARLAARDVPAVQLRPWRTSQAHQANESVPLANLPTAYEIMRSFLLS